MTKSKKRPYNSNSRKERARQSRAKILSTAKSLLEKNGYENTTISQLALKSRVSEPTIFALFKSKLGILRAIMDECFPVTDHTVLVEKAEKEKCPQKRLSIAAKLARNIYDAEINQSTLLQSACALSPEFEQLEKEREERRYHRLTPVVEAMQVENILDNKLSMTEALDIFWAFTGRDMYRLLVIGRKWSSDRYEAWLAETLSQTLLKKN
jgi:AcrR family transcriptional regulator